MTEPGDATGNVASADEDSERRAQPEPSQPPPDPAAYDTERNQVARQKGLPTPYIPGGEDPDYARAVAEDRRYLRLLLGMVIVIILAGFVLGVIAAVTGLTTLVGNPT